MFKKIKTTTIILLITLLPAFCFASGKIAAIKKGQKAPYNGILLDKTAEATITAKRESAVKICEIDKNYTVKKLKTECNFNKRLLTIEKEADKKRYNNLMALKNAEVKRLETTLKKLQKPDYSKLWFVGGFVAGVSLSIGIFYTAAQASR
jgi:glutaredoxin-related protein